MKTKYILNPDYILKNDTNRIILFSKRETNNGGRPGWLSYLHPIQAKILSFFTYDRSLEENILLLSEYLKKDFHSTHTIISPFIENEESLKAECGGQPVLFPKKLIIDSAKISSADKKITPIPVNDLTCKSAIDVSTKRVNCMPLNYTFMLTNKCVTKCKYCYADTDTKVTNRLPTERILELIRQSYDMGIININLIGGEIFLHKDWDIILDELIKHGYSPDIISTKFPLTERMIKRLEEIKFKNPIQVSFDSNNAEILSESLDVKIDYLEKMKKGIVLLDKSSLNYQIASVLTQYNISCESVSQMYEFIKTLNRLDSWTLRPAMSSIYKKDFEKIKPQKEQIKVLFDFVEKNILPQIKTRLELDRSLLNKEYYVAEKGSNSFKGARCSALNSHMFVLPDGKVTICEQLYWKPQFIIGDLHEQSIEEVWNSPRAQELINLTRSSTQKKSPCHSCNIFNQCFNIDKNRCWADIIKAYGDKNWDYPDPRCKKAPLMTSYLGL